MGTPPSSHKPRTSFNYQRIAKRHQPPKSSLSLKTVLMWVLVAVGALIAVDRFRPARQAAHPVPSAAISQPIEAPPMPEIRPAPPPAPIARDEPAPTPRYIAPAPVQEREPPQRPEPAVVREVLARDPSGNYFTQGLINGKQVRMLADTGASIVVVPEKIARQLNLKFGRAVMVKTAGGVVTAYETELETLTLGRIQMRKVAAMISPTMQDNFALLGMNALGLLQFSQENDTLVLSYDTAKAGSAPEEAAPETTESFQRSVKDCMKGGNAIDQKTLDCLRGE